MALESDSKSATTRSSSSSETRGVVPSAARVRFERWFSTHGPIMVVDGGLATELEANGVSVTGHLWSARILKENPAAIQAVHKAYFDAGAAVAISASYQASIEGFEKAGISRDECLELIKSSVTLAAAAREQVRKEHPDRELFVAGSVGPYGAILADGSEYTGKYSLSQEALVEFHRPRVEALLAAGADLLACETLPCIGDVKALAELLRSYPECIAWFTLSCGDSEHLWSGDTIADCIAVLMRDIPEQVVAIGVNCVKPEIVKDAVTHIQAQLALYSQAGHVRIIVYPNSGETYKAGDNTWHAGTSLSACMSSRHAEENAEIVAIASSWATAGATMIGGCCRTGPALIATLAANCATFAACAAAKQ